MGPGREGEDWAMIPLIPPLDKQAHALAGYAIAVSFGLTVSPALGLAYALVAGVLKEFYDSRHPESHTCDVWDFVATALGGLAGFALLILAK